MTSEYDKGKALVESYIKKKKGKASNSKVGQAVQKVRNRIEFAKGVYSAVKSHIPKSTHKKSGKKSSSGFDLMGGGFGDGYGGNDLLMGDLHSHKSRKRGRKGDGWGFL